MAAKQHDPEFLSEVLEVWRRHDNIATAAREMGVPRNTFASRLERAKTAEAEGKLVGATTPALEFPDFGDDDVPIDELLDIQIRRNRKRIKYRQNKHWFPIKVNVDGPIGLTWFGDPHVDDNFCNLELLKHHCDLHASTEGLYGANIGDTTNNWVGRLQRLFGEQDTSQMTARKLAKWLLADSGVTWMLWLLGNHDLWNEGEAILKEMNGHKVTMEKEPFPGTPMETWQAKFRLVFPNGRECRIWAAHDFPGHSMWNSLHSAQRAAHHQEMAHLYVCGHKHNWATHQEESASRGFVYWLARARGYKWVSDHAEKMGHAAQQEGASITAILDPDAKSEAGFISCFPDMDEAVDYLNWKRSR